MDEIWISTSNGLCFEVSVKDIKTLEKEIFERLLDVASEVQNLARRVSNAEGDDRLDGTSTVGSARRNRPFL